MGLKARDVTAETLNSSGEHNGLMDSVEQVIATVISQVISNGNLQLSSISHLILRDDTCPSDFLVSATHCVYVVTEVYYFLVDSSDQIAMRDAAIRIRAGIKTSMNSGQFISYIDERDQIAAFQYFVEDPNRNVDEYFKESAGDNKVQKSAAYKHIVGLAVTFSFYFFAALIFARVNSIQRREYQLPNSTFRATV